MQSFTDTVADSIRSLVRVYFADLAKHIATETGYEEEELAKAIESYTGSALSSLREENSFLPVYRPKTVINTKLTIGKLFEVFDKGNTRLSYYVSGTTGPTNAAYPFLSELNRSYTDRNCFKKYLNPKYIPFLRNNPDIKFQNVWIFPRDKETFIKGKFDELSIPYEEDDRYASTTGEEVDAVKSANSPKEVKPSVFTSEEEDRALEESSKEIINSVTQPVKKPTPTRPKGVAAKAAPKKKPTPKKAPVKKITGKFIKRPDGFYHNKTHGLLFEIDKEKEYPDKYYCVGSAESIKDDLCVLNEDDIKLLNSFGIKYDESVVDTSPLDEGEGEDEDDE